MNETLHLNSTASGLGAGGAPGTSKNTGLERRAGRTFLGAGAIVGLVWLIYWPALHGSWLWDDGYEVAHNSLLRNPAGLVKIWTGQGALDYFPLKATVQWILWRIWGANPTGWHAFSIALHGMNALLLWRLLHRLGLRQAWIGGLLFAVHPLAVESVAWVAELKNLLSLPLVFLSFGAYLDYDERGRSFDLWRAALLFLAAMLCKSTVVMLPCLLVLFLWWKHGTRGWRRRWSLVPFFAVALGLGLVTVWFQHQRAIGAADVAVGGMATRLARAGLALLFYAWKTVWPIELMPVYPRWPVSPPAVHQFLAWPILGAFFGWLWLKRNGWGRHVLFGAGAFVLNLAPILGFLAMAYMHASWVADHFVYAALPAAAGLFAGGVDAAVLRLAGPMRHFAAAALAALLVILVTLSWSYARIFRSPADFWSYAVEHNPDSSVAHNNLGNVFFAARQPTEAARHFAAAVRLEPGNAGMRINWGNALAELGRTNEAIRQHEMAVTAAPASAVALNSLGGTLLDAGRLTEARQHFESALRLQPDSAEARNNLGIVLARTGALTEARAHFEAAVRLNPGLNSARENLRLLEQQVARPPK